LSGFVSVMPHSDLVGRLVVVLDIINLIIYEPPG
jgi:hypothetical protein